MVYKQEEHELYSKWPHEETAQIFRVTLTWNSPAIPYSEGDTDLVCNICPEIPSKLGNQCAFFLMENHNETGISISLF